MPLTSIWHCLGPFWKGVVKGASLATVLFGLVVATPEAWKVLGLPVMATQGYVREETGKVRVLVDATRSTVIDTQIELAEGKREATEETLFKWNLELDKASDLQARALIQSRIRELNGQRSRLDQQLKVLYDARLEGRKL